MNLPSAKLYGLVDLSETAILGKSGVSALAAGNLWAHGPCGPIWSLLVVNDIPASPPPRALSSARKPRRAT